MQRNDSQGFIMQCGVLGQGHDTAQDREYEAVGGSRDGLLVGDGVCECMDCLDDGLLVWRDRRTATCIIIDSLSGPTHLAVLRASRVDAAGWMPC